MKIALVSLNSVWEDKQSNLISVENCIKSIGKNAEYIIFPEMTLTGFSVNNLDLAEDLENSESIKYFQQLAKKYNHNIIFGLLTKNKKFNYNSCVAINNKGSIDAIYNKIHLFTYASENKFIDRGTNIESISWNGEWGLSICYDLRFPELYQVLSKKNKIIVNIANWPINRVKHWKTLLKARAIECQAFMI